MLPEKPHEQRNLADYSLWSHKELDTTEQLHTHSLLLARTNLTNSLCSLNQTYLLFVLYILSSVSIWYNSSFFQVKKNQCAVENTLTLTYLPQLQGQNNKHSFKETFKNSIILLHVKSGSEYSFCEHREISTVLLGFLYFVCSPVF